MFKDVKFHFQNFFTIYVFTFSFLAILVILFFNIKIDDMNKGIIIGFLISSAKDAINFAIGSSKGSAAKDVAIQDLTRSAAKADAAEPADPNVLKNQPAVK